MNLKPMVDPLGVDKRLPRYVAVRDNLMHRIANGAWTIDKPMPSETKLAEEFGVSLGTIRRAVDELVREGTLERRHGSGTYLRRTDFSNSLMRFLKFRSSHSPDSTQKTVIHEVTLAKAPSYACEALKLKPRSNAIYIDRCRYHDNTLLVAEEIWVVQGRFAKLLTMPLEEVGPMLYRTYETACGQIIARAVECLHVVRADAAIAKRLGTKIGAPTVSIERTAYDLADAPVELRRSYGDAEHFEYRIEIK